MDLRTRRAHMEAMWKRYRKAPKKIKTNILDELYAATGFHRQDAVAQLNRMEDTFIEISTAGWRGHHSHEATISFRQ